MLRIRSPWDNGAHGIVIDVECHVSNGLPGIIIVGYANRAVDEAKERIRSSFASSKLELPRKRIVINLAPADIPKETTSFDAAVAVAILLASNQVQRDLPDSTAIIGEIGLDGTIRPVRGIIGKLLVGQENGIHTFILPEGNLEQAKLIPNITLLPVKNLKQLYTYLNQPDSEASVLVPIYTETGILAEGSTTTPEYPVQMSDIIGQQRAKRAMQIAAAGGHNILLNGPPGTGKSMLAKALLSILPPLSHAEIVEVTHLHSLTGSAYDKVVTMRPFRSPHHSASNVAILGGGHNLRPGEISLAHHGVLLFDELPEFNRSTIEALRQPLEDHVITIARAKETTTYPAEFIFVTTANPCPCGYYGTTKTCRCMPHEIQRYRKKLSGPILDRIDIYVEVDEVAHEQLLIERAHSEEENTEFIKTIRSARHVQQERLGNDKTNATMNNRDIKRCANLSASAKELLDQAAQKLDISARNYMRCVKVARTIADIDGSKMIETQHISEALQYRSHAYYAQE